MVIWKCTLSDGSVRAGTMSHASWKVLYDLPDDVYIVSMYIEHASGKRIYLNDLAENNRVLNCGYFLGQKVVANLGAEGFSRIIGFGYQKNPSDMVQVVWADENLQTLERTEVTKEQAGFFFLPNKVPSRN